MGSDYFKRTTKKRTLEERFWEKVEKTATCWLWRGATVNNGYGVLANADGTRWRAHRLSWEWVNGPVPDGMSVLHHCDTPSCVRPDHLFVGTQKDNMEDKVRKGRHYTPWTKVERQRHNFKEANLRAK